MDSCVNLDPSVFPYQDIRYTMGNDTGTKPKPKKDVKLAPVFVKPKVPMPGSVVIPVPIGGDSIKENPKRGDASSPSPARSGGTAGGFVDGDSLCASHGVNNTERSVVKYTPPVNNKGMCVSLLVVYYLFRW